VLFEQEGLAHHRGERSCETVKARCLRPTKAVITKKKGQNTKKKRGEGESFPLKGKPFMYRPETAKETDTGQAGTKRKNQPPPAR